MKLIEVRYFGMPKRRHFILNSKNITQILTKTVTSAPTNYSDAQTQSLQNAVTAKRSHSDAQTQSLVTPNGSVLINNINNNENNNKPQSNNNSLRSLLLDCGDTHEPTTSEIVVFGNANENDTKTKKTKKQTKKTTEFIPPTLEEVQMYSFEYAKQKNINLNHLLFAEKFMNYYSPKNWKNSKGIAVKDWKATIRQWILSGIEKGEYKPITTKQYDMNTIEGFNNKCLAAAEELRKRFKAQGYY